MKDSSEVIDQQIVRVRQRAGTFWSWSEATSTRLPEIAIVVVVAVAILFLTRDSWFFGDDWAFLIFRRDLWNSGQHFEAIFVPHNEHLSAVPAAVYLVVEKFFGIGSMLPYFVVLVAGHVAVLWAVRTIMVRLKVPMIWRIVGLVWLGFFGAGAENLVWPFQMSFIWAFALSLWGLLVFTGGERPTVRRDLGASALFTLGLFTASTSLSVTIVAACVLLVSSRSILRLLRVFAVPIGLYAAWYVFYGTSRMPHNPISKTQVIPYLTKALSFGLDQTFQFPTIGLILGSVALVLIASLDWFTPQQRRITAVLAAILFVFYLMSAVGRSFLGIEAATASRYVYFCGAMAIPFVLLAVSVVLERKPKLLPIAGVILAIAIVGNVGLFLSIRNDRLALTNESKWRFSMAAAHVMSPLADLEVVPDAQFTPDVSLAGIRSLREGGIWSYDVPLSTQQLLEGSLQFGIRTFQTTPDATLQSYKLAVVGVEGLSLISGEGGCFVARPTSPAPVIVLEQRQAGTFSIDTGGVPSALRLQVEGDPAVRTEPKDLLTGGAVGPVWVGVFPVFGQPVIELPSDSETTLCGLDRR
jgi:hypothetical protein